MSKDEIPLKTPISKDLPEVDQELSQVASNPKQNILIIIVVITIFIYLFYSLFFNSDDKDKNKEITPLPREVAKPISPLADNDIPSIPTLPTPPKLEDPTPPLPPVQESLPLPPPPPPPPSPSPAVPSDPLPLPEANIAPALPIAKVHDDESQRKRAAKLKSAILLVSGTVPAKTPEQLQEEENFSYRGDMTLVLGRGKMLDAIIETAVNTDFGGEIRAVITKDIYSEWGKNILLPKGSRVIGNYATGIKGAYGRISIEWTRIDLANGYSLNLSGSGVDNLGRKGNQGRVDNKFKERFSNAVLRSVFNIALAKTMDTIVKPPINSQAAATQNETASNIKNIALGISLQTTLTPNAKFEEICARVPAAIPDKTSTTYTQIMATCNALRTNPAIADPAQKLLSLMTAINSTSDSLTQTAATNTQPSKVQAASTQAVTDISDTVKDLIDEQEFKPTITIDQGTAVKIYVNKDYKFPKAAIGKRSGL